MDFTQIPASLKYPMKYKANLSSIHSELVTAFASSHNHSIKSKRRIVDIINIVSYIVISGESFPDSWNLSNPLSSIDLEDYADAIDIESRLGELYVNFTDIHWDINTDCEYVAESVNSVQTDKNEFETTISTSTEKTPIDDVLLEPRKIPRFDFSKPWLRQSIHGVTYTIPTSLPLKPERSQDITVSTDVNMMSDFDIDKLFPNWFMHTRGVSLYKPLDGVELDPDFGLIFQFDGFTREQVIDNIIKYPYLYNVTRFVDGSVQDFYLNIEISGELHSTDAVWDSLADTKYLPKTKRFMTEYVVRRYLLERDIKGISHKYPIRGSFDPYLVLFMPKDMYIQHGYQDVGRLHVQSRVNYLQLLNPIISFLYGTGNTYCVSECPFSNQCTEIVCDKSCPRNAELMYLLERNKLSMQSPVFQSTDSMIQKASKLLHIDESIIVVQSDKPVDASELIVYLACCEKWHGNCYNCSVYHLNFSGYLSDLQRSFSMQNKPDSLEYEELFMSYAPTLIISGLDYIQFKDFSAQELINLIGNRERERKKTIVVCQKVDNLVGKGQSFEQLRGWLRKAVVR